MTIKMPGFALAVVLAAACASAQAGTAGERQSAPRTYTERGDVLPTHVSSNGVSYVCGGEDARERSALQAMAGQHDLMLTFADRQGRHLSDVEVQLRDAQGRAVLDVSCPGPMMLVDLPRTGDYRLTASTPAGELERRIHVPADGTAAVVVQLPTAG